MTSQTFNFDSNTVGDTTVTGLTINTDPTITTFGYTVSATQAVSPLNSLKANLFISGSPNSSFYPTSFTGINDQSSTVDLWVTAAGSGNTTPFCFVRGNITGSTFLTGSAYFLKMSLNPGGGGISIQKRVSGANTTIGGTIASTNFTYSAWYTAKIKVVGTAITCTIVRQSDGFYLTSAGTFVSTTPVNCMSATDSALTTGYPGVALNQTNVSAVYFDNFIAGDESPGLTAPVLSNAGVSSTAFGLTWTASTGGTAPYSYQVQRSVSGGAYANLGSPTTNLFYNDHTVAASTLEAYKVIATDAASATATSNIITATTDADGTANVLRTVPSVSVTPTTARVAFCVTTPDTVQLKYGTASNLAGATTTSAVIVDPQAGNAGKFDVSGLTANTKYYYDILVNGVSKLSASYPSFSTFKSATGQVRKFAFSSCMKAGIGNDDAWSRPPAVDAAFLIGDTVYGDEDAAVTTFGVETNDVEYFRQLNRYSLAGGNASNTSWAALRKTTPVFSQIDDHDTGTNDYSGTSIYYTNAIQAFKELNGGANPDPYRAGVLYYTVDCGDYGFFVADMRSFRSANTTADNNGKSILGTQQFTDLKAWLSANNSAYKFKILMFSVPAHGYAANTAGDSMGGIYDTFQVPTAANGFRWERNLLWDYVDANKITGVVTCSGDQHWGGAFKTSYAGRNRYEFMSSPVNHGTLAPPVGVTPDLTNGPVYFTYQNDNVGLLTIDTSVIDPTITFQLYSAFGSAGSGNTKTIAKSAIDANFPTTGAATTYAINGDTTLTNGQASIYTVVPDGVYTGTITPSFGIAGTLSPTSLTFSGSSVPQTFSFTPSTSGSGSITGASSPSLTNPAAQAITVTSGGGGGGTAVNVQVVDNGTIVHVFADQKTGITIV